MCAMRWKRSKITALYASETRAMLESHCILLFKSGIWVPCWVGKSQFHKGKAAGAGKHEQAEGLLCCLFARAGVQTKARAEKKEQAQPNAFGTHWERAGRGPGKRATGHASARQKVEGEPQPSGHRKAPE